MAEQPKTWMKRTLVGTGALHLLSRMRRPGIAILMYHSVMDNPEPHASTLGGIVHPRKIFREQMEVLAREYHPVSLDDVLHFLEGKSRLPAKAVVMTFDDGYSDNAEVAAPILNQLGIPATFYLTVGCLDKNIFPWVARLRFAFFTTKRSSWTDAGGSCIPTTSPSERVRAYDAACAQCAALTGEAQQQFVSAIERDLETDAIPENQRVMMTWNQARKLAAQGHIVGSHTMTHPNMAHVRGDGELREEFVLSKERLEQELGQPAIHFSYPCPILDPHWSPRTVDLSRQAGYRTAVTTNPGLVRQGDDPLTLHRIVPARTADDLRWNLECTFAGRLS
jgi:peptidoglycan/xylan/chitin deacetylase (PgdA/CDA1 family)